MAMQARETDQSKPGRALRSERGFTCLEYLVVIAVMIFIVGMGFIVLLNMRDNAYDARARQNYESAEEDVRNYWISVGREQGDYKGMTAQYMNGSASAGEWVEADTAAFDVSDYGDLPLEYFTSILIIREESMPEDEIMVATISETGTVFFSHFKEAATLESSKLAFADFKEREDQHLQANAAGQASSR